MSKFIYRLKNKSDRSGLNRVQVDHVNVAVGMEPANVSTNIRGLLRTIEAIRTVEPGQLAALVFQVLLQIVLPVEDAVAVRARKPHSVP